MRFDGQKMGKLQAYGLNGATTGAAASDAPWAFQRLSAVRNYSDKFVPSHFKLATPA